MVAPSLRKKNGPKITILQKLAVVALNIIAFVAFITWRDDDFITFESIADSVVAPTMKDNEAILYTSCLEETLQSLPIGKGPRHKRKNLPDDQLLVWAHHFDARSGKWNMDIRFEEMEELTHQPCSVWEVGAHTKAEDSSVLLKKYPNCEYHAYEPIPNYFASLAKHWEDTSNMYTHNYGLAHEDGEFKVSSSLLKGQSTYIGDSKNEGDVLATIKSFEFAVKEAGSKPTLLHMNCEGCEWDLLSQGIEDGFISDIPVVQIGFHNYGQVGLGKRAIEYCEIRKKLSRTHRLVDGAVPFAWERWVLK